MVNFPKNTDIVLKDIAQHRIQLIIKIYADASMSKIYFFHKSKPYGLHIKIELINQDKWNGHNFPLKYLELVLVTLSLITPIGTK